MKTRHADLDDVDWIVGEMEQAAGAYGTRIGVYPGEGKGRSIVEQMIEMPEKFLVLISEQDNRRTGCIAGGRFPHFFNAEIMEMAVLWLWVSGKFRGGTTASSLLSRFVELASSDNNWISFGVGVNSSLKESSLAEYGFRLQDRNYLLEVNHGG